MDANMEDAVQQGSSKRPHPDLLSENNSMAKLARTYDDKVRSTRSAQGLESKEDRDDNCEVTTIGEKVAEQAAVVRTDYRQAPTLTLHELIPTRFKPERGPAAEKYHASFRSERVEFVVMCRKLVATRAEDLEWDFP